MASTFTPKVDDRFRITVKYLQSIYQQLNSSPKSERERWLAKDIKTILQKHKGTDHE